LSFPYLSTIIFLPLVGAIIIALFPGNRPKLTRYLAAIFTFIPLVLAVILFAQFDKSLGAAGIIQFEEKLSWITPLNAFYHLGVDGAVNGVADGAIAGGRAIRRMQTGQLQLYGLVIGIGIVAIVLVLYIFG